MCLILIAADQCSKFYVQNNFELFESVSILDNYLHLTYIKNAGAAFGILQNYQLLFIIFTIIFLVVILFYYLITPDENRILKTSLILIFAGGAGNLIDRIRLGYVVDFIDIRIWPIFNVADSLVVIGTILLTYFILFKYKPVNKGA